MKKLDEAAHARAHLREERRLGRPLQLVENRATRKATLPIGDDIRGTANLFVGPGKSNGIFRRNVPYGQRVRDSDTVLLTGYGRDLAGG